MFTKKQLIQLILPLVVEQFLAVAVGMADIIMVSKAGESAISGVSLVDTINVLLINIFTAMATGGAVVVSQYIGQKNRDNACEAANQLLLSTGYIAIGVSALSILGNVCFLQLILGNIDAEIMENARLYFYITAVSFPFLAIYNCCAALFRSMGNSTISMKISMVMNIVNIIGNAVFVYGFAMGVEGVAIPSLLSRALAAFLMIRLLRNPIYPVNIRENFSFHLNMDMVKSILQIGIPNGLENGMFQIGKILVLRIVTSFGAMAITANAVSNTVAAFAALPGLAAGLALITVVGQCVGAKDYEQAKKYTRLIMTGTITEMIVLNTVLILSLPIILNWYHLSTETAALTRKILIYHSIFCFFFWPLSFSLPNALRAASDVRYTMIVAILSMWIWRIGFSFVLGKTFGMGVFGIWVAMSIDWVFRSVCFVVRFMRGKWQYKYHEPA